MESLGRTPNHHSITARTAEELQHLARTMIYVVERSGAVSEPPDPEERKHLEGLLPDLRNLQGLIEAILQVRAPQSNFGVPAAGGDDEPGAPQFGSICPSYAAAETAGLVSSWQEQGRDTSDLRRALFEEGAESGAGSTRRDQPPRSADELLEDLMNQEQGTHSMNGTTRSLSLDTVFQFLARSNRTGRLLVRTNEETLTFALLEGDLVFTATDTPRPGQRLGELLIEDGQIDSGALAQALGECDGTETRIGRIFEDQLQVPHDALAAALQTQARLRYERARGCEAAAFAFFPGPGAETDALRMKVLELLLESVRRSDEAQRDAAVASE